MFNPFKTLSTLAVIAFAGSAAFAQDAAPTTTTTPAPESAAPAVGEPYIRDQHGDWSIRCIKADEGQMDPCQLYQLLLDAEGNAVAEINLFALPDGGEAVAGANIVAPLETLLPTGLTIQVDSQDARRYPFTFCNRGGCVARVGFTAEEVRQFKNGRKAIMTLAHAAAPDTPIALEISLTGFTAGFDAAGPAAQ